MVGKQRIELWLNYEDYQVLKRHPTKTISEQVREAIASYVDTWNMGVDVKKLQGVIKQYEKIVAGNQTDELTPNSRPATL